LMFRRTLIEQIGPWDTVNKGGDSEFLTRLIEYVGSENVLHLSDRPLSFSRVWSGSLTSGEMSRGFFAYSRLLYRWAFRQWHWQQGKLGKKSFSNPQEIRPYAVPTTFETGDQYRDLGIFDVIYATDFFRQSKYIDRALVEIETLVESGLRVGYMHLYSPQTSRHAGIPPKLFEMQASGRLSQVSQDDKAEAKLLLLIDLSIGMFLDELQSTVRVSRGVAIDQEQPQLFGAEDRSPTSFIQSLRNLNSSFDVDFEVVGSTLEKQRELVEEVPKDRLLPSTLVWVTHVKSKAAPIIPPWGRPVVGFHSYGNRYRWPNNLASFRSAYNPGKYTVKLYGQIDVVIKEFGEDALESVELIDSHTSNETEFLASIDFWVYFPHPRLKDGVWEPVLNAMQAGKVVVLPHRLQAIYGDAAIYAEHHNIEESVTFFSQNPDAYITQAERGQHFIAENYTPDRFIQRVQKLMP